MKNEQQGARKVVGAQGEQAVVDYLVKQGYTICARNYRIAQGEIDIIASKERVIAFIEVKARTTLYFNLSEVIVPAKQRKIIYTARQYIFRQAMREMVYRFDVALLSQASGTTGSAAPLWNITYIKDAFTDRENLL